MPAKRRAKNKKTKKGSVANTEPMPSLIFNSINLENNSADKKENKDIPKIFFPGNHGAKKIMWSGVLAISAVIFLMWGWAIVARISHLNIGTSPEGQMAVSAKKDWNQIFEETKIQENKKQAINQIKQIIGQVIATYETSTPSTLLPPNSPASSTAIISTSTNFTDKKNTQ